MPKLSVCIEMFWRDRPFAERIAQVARLGYQAFEFWGWDNKDIPAVAAAQSEAGLAVAAICHVPGNSLIKRGAEKELVQGMVRTAEVAAALKCPTVIVTTGNTLDDERYEASRRRVVRHLRAVGQVAADHGLTLVLEPLNTLVDHHGYWLTRMSEAVDIVQELDSPAVKILMDIYHQQIQEGHIIDNLTAYCAHIGHVHVAGVPGRHELVGGELDFRSIFRAIDAAGYEGFVGLEYAPLLREADSLAQPLRLLGG
ncbi:MAG: TIM barrel protein [Chloroflexi bacterium]|jgi:hydroxypyruvate isomerase|nr:TIM barrel protein [Chloroflexota bacterium]